MPAHKRDPKRIEKAVRVWLANDCSRGRAAKRLKVSESTLGAMITEAKRTGLVDRVIAEAGDHARSRQEVEAVVTPPVLPSGDVPVTKLIPRMVEDARRRIAAHEARRGFIPIPVKMAGPICVAFIGDPHVDDAGCHWPKLYEDVDTIQKNKAIVSVGMGDYTNNWVGRLGRLYAEQSTTKRSSWDLVRWLIPALRPILLLKGNHNLWSGQDDPLDFMRETAEPWTEAWQAKVELQFPGGKAWRFVAAHDFKGSSMWNPLHANQRKAKFSGVRAHFYVAGHRHEWGLAQHEDAESGHVYWLGRARGYKVIDQHADVNGYDSQSFGHTVAAVIDPSAPPGPRFGQMFADLQEAADYLAFKRRKAA